MIYLVRVYENGQPKPDQDFAVSIPEAKSVDQSLSGILENFRRKNPGKEVKAERCNLSDLTYNQREELYADYGL